ncbi:MAG: hypothetical protein HY291_15040 [Planctomycetes bacterium]|nr:hypothetical protein [Planctomycetota bacterium]
MARVSILVLAGFLLLTGPAHGVDEHIRGVLEKTARTDACAQITDALNEIYYVAKGDAAEKMCADLLGKRVVLTGTVEQHAGDTAYYLVLKKAEAYQAKLPAAPKTPDGKAETSMPLPPAGPAPLPLPKEEKSAAPEPKKDAPGPAKDTPKKTEEK